MKKLTGRQKKFIREYVKCDNATQAAIKAGYSEKTAYQIGHENLHKPEIKEEIQKLQKQIELEFSYSIYKSFKNFEKMQGIIIGEGKDEDVKRLKENPPLIRAYIKAEEQKGKLTGLYTEKHVHTGDIIVHHMGTVKVGENSLTLNVGKSLDNATNTDNGTSENTGRAGEDASIDMEVQ